MTRRRTALLILALAVLAIVVALPALAATPPPSAPPHATHEPDETDGPHATKGPKAPNDHEGADADETTVTVNGTVHASAGADGETGYTLESAGTTYTLDAGPNWFFGDAYPLKPYVGKSVTITGESATGSTDVDVLTVDGKELRAPGKPPWAGGWKVVGKAHPGWSQDKADRLNGKSGGCFPPGQCKDKAPQPTPTP